MRSYAAWVLVALAAICRTTHGQSQPVVALSGDDTRHGIEVLYGRFSGVEGIEIMRYHVDTLIQTRFARTTIEMKIRNNYVTPDEFVAPFAIPENAMLVNFEIESGGMKHQARAVLKEDIEVAFSSNSATIKARDAEGFDVTLKLVAGGIILLRVQYDELLTRKLGRYTNVQQIWPGQVVSDLRLSVRIKEASAIEDSVKYSLSSETSTEALPPLETSKLFQVSKVQLPNGLAEIQISARPSLEEQRDLAQQLALAPQVGFKGQFNVEYDVERYPTAGDIVVRDGYFAHFFAPSDLNSTTALPKYALFLLDTSGSMQGRKVDQLIDAMKTILGELGPDDYFTVIEFSDSNKVWDLYLPSATGGQCNVYPKSAVPTAQKHAESMHADGGTALRGGLELALDCAANTRQGLEPILLVLTDGQPNESTDSIINDTTTRNRQQGSNDLLASVFTIALGDDANLDFLRELALKNGGSTKQIYVASDASDQLRDFYRTIGTPLLTDVTIQFDYNQVDNTTLTKSDFRTFFYGSELVVAGRLLPGQSDQLSGEVKALGAGGQVVSYPIQVNTLASWKPEKLSGQPNSQRLWAFLRTSQLLDQAVVDGGISAAANESISLALEYSFVTTNTCLAVDIVNPDERPTPEPVTIDPDDTNWTPRPTGRPGPPQPTRSPQPTGRPGPPQPTGTPQPTGRPGPPQPTGRPGPPQPTGSPQPTQRPGPPQPTGPPGPPQPTGRPGPPGPPQPTGRPGPPGPPQPTSQPGGRSGINALNIGSISIQSMAVSGPLIQFNFR